MNIGNTDILNLLFRTTVIFIVLLTSTRVLGKKQMSHLTFFNYVTGITIGSIAANVVSDIHRPITDEVIGLIWWCVLSSLASYISLKSGKIRYILDGQPTILIKKGKIIKDSLFSTGLNIDDLSMLLRKNSVFSILEVEYAILEPNGSLSIMKKPEHHQPTKSDMKIPVSEIKYMPSEIISDGKIIKHNLKEFNLDEKWVKDELAKQNINSIKDVFYAEIQSDGTLFIDKNS